MQPDAVRWSFPTSITIGPGVISGLAATCRQHGITRPLVVTDPGLAGLTMFGDVLASFESTPAVFADVQPNPVGANIDAGVRVFVDGGHDGVVAVGGGSALDAGKVIAFQAGQFRPVWDFEDVGDNWTRADASTISPVIAVPTTAGTGSEVGRAGLVIDESSDRKVIVFHPKMLPIEVLCDPELTVGLPPTITVGTGMDALSHSLEALCAPNFHPMAHGIGLEGCRLVIEHLPRVVADPGDIDSRTQMMAAAAMGAVAFQKGLGAMHALAHPIGAMFDTHHGMTNAVLMPYVLLANRRAIEATVEQLARHCEIDGGFDGVLDHVIGMRSDFGVPDTLVDLGVDLGASARVATAAVEDPSAAGNPIPFTFDLAEAIFGAACTGDLGANT